MKPTQINHRIRNIINVFIIIVFLLPFSSKLCAQDTIRSLVITEARLKAQFLAYIELTNMGEYPIQLNQFELGSLVYNNRPFSPKSGRYFRLPDKLLQPGEIFIICAAHDYGPEQHASGKIEEFTEVLNKPELLEIADFIIHMPESNPPASTDSVTPGIWETFLLGGDHCVYIEQHFANGDTVVIDQVNGVFDGEGGTVSGNYSDVAGFAYASDIATLIRKFTIKKGNIDFANARGIGEEDSEWIVVPTPGYANRKLFWTAGNHVNAILNENTLEPTTDEVSVDFSNKTITVPWGTRRFDDIMKYFKQKPGIAWNYHHNTNPKDSLTHAAKTGDQLELFVCGNEVQKALFSIKVKEPSTNANLVIPVANADPSFNWRLFVDIGYIDWPWVTRHETEIDTIRGYGGGIPYATRRDSLLKRLEKAPNATWKFEWVDGIERTELKEGDVLKVTAENGEVKRYYISVLYELKNHNPYLSSITWPDIPELHKGIFGWKGDTIPNFSPTVYNYILTVPLDVEGIPALVAKTNNVNARVDVKRAKNLRGTKEDRTITFTVTAEDDSTTRTYNIELVKEQDPVDIQPWFADPYISEFIFWEQWSNGFLEIFNPGNQPLDLSNYMILGGWANNPAEAITWWSGENDWLNRYSKYVPGYKWVNELQWAVTPGILEQDLAVNPIMMPGDVFCLGGIYQSNFTKPNPVWGGASADYIWPIPGQLDVQFNNDFNDWGIKGNPWNEDVGLNAPRQWTGANLYLYKILNDSVKLGLKPAIDPNDFELLDVFGNGDGTEWNAGGIVHGMITNFMRKPDIWHGNTEFSGSFGNTPEESEWTWTNQNYWNQLNAGWPYSILYVGNDLGKHYSFAVTHFMSTVSSVVYKVSPGYGKGGTLESIRGMTPGVTAAEFLAKLVKKNEGQNLKIIGTAGELTMDELLNNNDTLVVTSADSTNVTKYLLEVAEGGLSSDAVLTSSKFFIIIESEPKNGSEIEDAGVATITGFDYGTSLKTILANITVPAGANIDVIDGNGAYIPLIQLNNKTVYINVTVNSDTYLDVIAENGVTEIVYQLIPDVTDDDAFVLSDVYSVSQRNLLIEYVPRGTNVNTLLANLVPSAGAKVKLVNKMGQERTEGKIYQDDKVVVTSANGMIVKVYYLSMLAEKYIPETTYLAYITSTVYSIDQLEMKIAEVADNTSVTEFFANITPAIGATAIVVDINGFEKTTGTITRTDLIMVTSLDGKTTVYYSIGHITSAETPGNINIELYPNPTDGKIYITGVDQGTSISIYNTIGSKIREIENTERIEKVSLDDQPSGIYLFYISDGKKVYGSYKVIKQ